MYLLSLLRPTLAGCLLRTSAVDLGKPVLACLSSFINLHAQILTSVSIRGTFSATGVAVVERHSNFHIGPGWWLRYFNTASEIPETLLRAPPSIDTAPLPSSDTCPSLEALDAQIQRNSYNYTLRHVAEGFVTLSMLSSVHGAPEANAARLRTHPAVATATLHQAGRIPAGSAAVSDRNSLDHFSEPHSTANQVDKASAAPDGHATPQALSEQCPHGVTACARRLSILGQYQMKREVDLAAMALCIRGIGALGMPHAARAQLALPFVKRLRDPSYFFSMRSQPTEALISVLHALGKLLLHRHLKPPDIPSYAQVIERLVKSLMPHVASISAQDACRVSTALARLGCTSQRREAQLYQEFLQHRHTAPTPEPCHLSSRDAFFVLRGPAPQALAAHIASDLTAVSPGQAVRLLWAYGILLPASCSQAAGSSSSSGNKPTATATKQSTGPKPTPLANAAQAGHAVPQMVVGLSRVACRALDVQPPLELVKLVSAMSQLGSQREAEAVLSRVTPRLLRELHRLDIAALADVASAYHLSRVHEPGLLQAVADQVMRHPSGFPGWTRVS
ncbi:hypothetical protein Vafri_2920 [Volvox africanus]|uniref:Uncharacterized protein n=1 Tax=Volvox africanus TaxID=51714 RepID=A0A8J4AS50_9CHLO|nr:hypothetical protein Vafri_2920 [Volvox africanus]